MVILLFMYLASGLLLVGLSVPLLLGKIGPNGLYGFRTAATMKDAQLWYAVNCYAAKRLLIAGAAIALAALILYTLPGITVDGYALGCLAVFLLTFLPGLAQSIIYMRRLTHNHHPDNQ